VRRRGAVLKELAHRSPRRARAAVAALALALPAASAANPPGVDYMLQCQGCHLADGSGSPGSVPSLRGSVGRFLTVPGGRAYLVRVPGSSQSALDDGALAAVLNWMIRSFGPEEVARDFEPYSGEEVGHLRRPPLTDVAATREELVRRIEAASSSGAAR
jgi:hypothetical protein